MKWGTALSRSQYERTIQGLIAANDDIGRRQEEGPVFYDDEGLPESIAGSLNKINLTLKEPCQQQEPDVENTLKMKYDEAERLYPLSEPKRLKKKYIRGPYRKYTVDLKEKAIKTAYLLNDPVKASQMHRVPIKNLRRWLKNGIKTRKGGRKTRDPDMEENLKHWILEFERTHLELPSKKLIVNKALELTKYKDVFKASKGWYEKFIIRQFPGNSFRFKKVPSKCYSGVVLDTSIGPIIPQKEFTNEKQHE